MYENNEHGWEEAYIKCDPESVAEFEDDYEYGDHFNVDFEDEMLKKMCECAGLVFVL